MNDIVERLNGKYRIPITDGLGPAGGEEPDNPYEFVRTLQSTPIEREAADEITRLRGENERLRKENAALRDGLHAIAVGDGTYGAQAYEYKQAARAALAKAQSEK